MISNKKVVLILLKKLQILSLNQKSRTTLFTTIWISYQEILTLSKKIIKNLKGK
jgi:hypothetical protein